MLIISIDAHFQPLLYSYDINLSFPFYIPATNYIFSNDCLDTYIFSVIFL